MDSRTPSVEFLTDEDNLALYELTKIQAELVVFLEKTCGVKEILADQFLGLFRKNLSPKTPNQDDTQNLLYLNTPASIQKRNEIFATMLKQEIDKVLEVKKTLNYYQTQLIEYFQIAQAQIDKAISEKKSNENYALTLEELQRAKVFIEQINSIKANMDKLLVELTVQEKQLKAAITENIVSIVDIYKEKISEVIKNFSIPDDGKAETKFLNSIIKESKSEFETIPTAIEDYLSNNKNINIQDLDNFIANKVESIITDAVKNHPEAEKFPDIAQGIKSAADVFRTQFWENDTKRQELVTNHLRLNQVHEQQLEVCQESIANATKTSETVNSIAEKYESLNLAEVPSIPQELNQVENAIENNFRALAGVINNNLEQNNAAIPRLSTLSERLKAAREKKQANLQAAPVEAPQANVENKGENNNEDKPNQILRDRPEDKIEAKDNKQDEHDNQDNRPRGP